jgi:hypothetical protein
LAYTLYNISRLRKYLTVDATIRVVNALILTRLDYQNSLLYGIPYLKIKALQRILNMAARINFGLSKYDSVSQYLARLNWLPVEYRIRLKVLVLTYKSLNGLSPVYLSNLLTKYTPARSLRSENANLLDIPKTKMKTVGDRSFSAAAPRLWNQLPAYVKDSNSLNLFKLNVKKLMLQEAYPNYI